MVIIASGEGEIDREWHTKMSPTAKRPPSLFASQKHAYKQFWPFTPRFFINGTFIARHSLRLATSQTTPRSHQDAWNQAILEYLEQSQDS